MPKTSCEDIIASLRVDVLAPLKVLKGQGGKKQETRVDNKGKGTLERLRKETATYQVSPRR
jgi:hypothetical protein